MKPETGHVLNMLKADGIDLTEAQIAFLDQSGNQVNSYMAGASAVYSTLILRDAMEKHARALDVAGEASNRYADEAVKAAQGLNRATCMLVAVTFLLFIATLIPILRDLC